MTSRRTQRCRRQEFHPVAMEQRHGFLEEREFAQHGSSSVCRDTHSSPRPPPRSKGTCERNSRTQGRVPKDSPTTVPMSRHAPCRSAERGVVSRAWPRLRPLVVDTSSQGTRSRWPSPQGRNTFAEHHAAAQSRACCRREPRVPVSGAEIPKRQRPSRFPCISWPGQCSLSENPSIYFPLMSPRRTPMSTGSGRCLTTPGSPDSSSLRHRLDHGPDPGRAHHGRDVHDLETHRGQILSPWRRAAPSPYTGALFAPVKHHRFDQNSYRALFHIRHSSAL
ncbi:hypothetical protein Q5P01_000430 [Channa striata]|uniref:Uncharacterized protein n=1 Tax=Channa striata TaxID=64152 RepID=A0AA88IC24_CHASR|nr:hypothetical protein Q5P01_000430 [Channa striata]